MMPIENRNGFIYISIGMCIVSITGIILALVGCTWCHKKWKKLTQRSYRLSSTPHDTLPGTIQNAREFTIFPPPSSNQFSFPMGVNPEEVVFEPLPEIRSRGLATVAENIRPARFTGCYGKVSLQDWFDELQINFPRNQLKYLREVGNTWYGQAIEGEAYNIVPENEKTKVVVKILRIDASATEHMQYLQETRPFRDLNHPHLLHLYGRCLEVHPFLLIMEHCDKDLKTCLIEQRKTPEILLKDGLLLKMACNIASALQYMHEHGFIHTDIAAHNCLVTSDFVVKIGDYGNAVNIHRSDFYCLGDVAFPIRWCAPETLTCTESVIEAKDITREANIWSLGVLLWELLEFGKLPYFDLNDDEVIQKVLIECSLKLEQPKTPCIHKDLIYKIMQLCWLPSMLRPTIHKVVALLNYLYENKDIQSESSAFESRWNKLQPVLREHNLQNASPHVALQFESDFIPKKEQDISRDCDSMMSSDFDNYGGNKSPSSGSFSLGFENDLAANISPSLLNLRGSVEDLIVTNSHDANKLNKFNDVNSNCETRISEQAFFTNENNEFELTEQSISEAIGNLDTILADEASSSDTSKCATPEIVKSKILKSKDLSQVRSEDHVAINGINCIKNEINCNSHNDSIVLNINNETFNS